MSFTLEINRLKKIIVVYAEILTANLFIIYNKYGPFFLSSYLTHNTQFDFLRRSVKAVGFTHKISVEKYKPIQNINLQVFH